jgi:transposase
MKTTAITIGLDVSDEHTHVCALDQAGEVILRERLETREPVLRRFFSGKEPMRVALEVGRQSPWMSRLIQELGHEVLVANPRKIKLIFGNETKNDRLDAERLARLARVDPKLLHPVKHRQKHTQAALAIVRSRELIVRQRTGLINSVRGQVKAMGGKLPGGHIWTFHELLDEVPEELHVAIAPLMEMIGACSEQIRHYDSLVDELTRNVYPETEILRQVWGVGPLTALAYVLVVETPERFRSSRTLGSYFGLRPRQDQSGAVDKQLRITKTGDPLVRKLLVQCAHRVLSAGAPDTDLKRWGIKLAERGGQATKKRAIIAVARKLAVLFHRLWVTESTYEPLRNADPDLQDLQVA